MNACLIIDWIIPLISMILYYELHISLFCLCVRHQPLGERPETSSVSSHAHGWTSQEVLTWKV